ncbi:MAG: hypothetical protein HZB65_04515 [Candidatus Aenigmarchaeota archaeon]|nr:hypothetical protein [Candidatus Aenigmarchaeota archaeon]
MNEKAQYENTAVEKREDIIFIADLDRSIRKGYLIFDLLKLYYEKGFFNEDVYNKIIGLRGAYDSEELSYQQFSPQAFEFACFGVKGQKDAQLREITDEYLKDPKNHHLYEKPGRNSRQLFDFFNARMLTLLLTASQQEGADAFIKHVLPFDYRIGGMAMTDENGIRTGESVQNLAEADTKKKASQKFIDLYNKGVEEYNRKASKTEKKNKILHVVTFGDKPEDLLVHKDVKYRMFPTGDTGKIKQALVYDGQVFTKHDSDVFQDIDKLLQELDIDAMEHLGIFKLIGKFFVQKRKTM